MAETPEEKRPVETKRLASQSSEFINPESTRGVLYVPRVPPYMQAAKLRHLLSQFGAIGRIYLTPEDSTEYEKRVKSGGQKKMMFKDGWIEFMDKKIAKRVAESLNGTAIGGKKGHNFYRDDMWTLRYLSKFTWSDLNEHLAAKRETRSKRLNQRQERQAKEDEFYLKNVLKAQAKDRKRKREGSEAGQVDEDKEWVFRQKSARVASAQTLSSSLLDSLAI
jgi:ESF2/ABP1 family protein